MRTLKQDVPVLLRLVVVMTLRQDRVTSMSSGVVGRKRMDGTVLYLQVTRCRRET